MRVWIDIENPPQVQYLLPLTNAFERAGVETSVTARDYGFTLQLLRERGVSFDAVGEAFGRGKLKKAIGLTRRTRALQRWIRDTGERPAAVVSSSRASALVARRLHIPSFIVCDYEHAELTIYRLAGSYLLHPDVIDAEVFLAKGFERSRLIPFNGLKEDITFSRLDTEAVVPLQLDGRDDLVRVLFRPPAEESHYYQRESRTLAIQVLERLAATSEAVTIFSPRDLRQREYLTSFQWVTEPILLNSALPFLELLKSVDLVVSSGGTMLREAAWLGVPAYSVFQSRTGSVDDYLQSIGRLELISSAEEFDAVPLVKRRDPAPPLRVEAVPEHLVEVVLERTGPA